MQDLVSTGALLYIALIYIYIYVFNYDVRKSYGNYTTAADCPQNQSYESKQILT